MAKSDILLFFSVLLLLEKWEKWNNLQFLAHFSIFLFFPKNGKMESLVFFAAVFRDVMQRSIPQTAASFELLSFPLCNQYGSWCDQSEFGSHVQTVRNIRN